MGYNTNIRMENPAQNAKVVQPASLEREYCQ